MSGPVVEAGPGSEPHTNPMAKKKRLPCRQNAHPFCLVGIWRAPRPRETVLPSMRNDMFLQKLRSRLRKTIIFELWRMAGDHPGARDVDGAVAWLGPVLGPWLAPLIKHSFPLTRNAMF